MAILTIKDGNGTSVDLHTEVGPSGNKVSAQAQVAVTTTADLMKYYPYGPNGWDWSTNSGTLEILDANLNRKAAIIHNSGSSASAYILIGGLGTNNGFGSMSDKTSPPPNYTFILEPGGTYFGDVSSCALKHSMFVASGSNLTNSGSIIVTVTEIT